MVSAARIDPDGAGLRAELWQPQRGVAAGQALVMYDGDRVLGSATIIETVADPGAGPVSDADQPPAARRPAVGAG
jgi:tRNA-specific 2-thiouridylase